MLENALERLKLSICSCEWEGGRIGLRRFSLRFPDAQQETGFVETRGEKLRNNVCVLAGMLTVVTALLILIYLADMSRVRRLGATAVYVQDIRIASLGIAGFVALLVMVTRICNRFSIACQEVVIMFSVLTCMCVHMTMNGSPWTPTKMVGANPYSVWSETCFSETTTILIIDIYITVSHVALPIRWQFLFVLEVTSLVAYAVLTSVYGTPEASLTNYLMLCALVLGSGLGKRTNEINERKLFAQTDREFSSQDRGYMYLYQDAGPHEATPDIIGRAEGSITLISKIGLRDHWLISAENLLLLPQEVMGVGAYSLVIGGLFQSARVAVKFSRIVLQTRHLTDLAKEVRILHQCRHPNLAEFYGAAIDPENQRFAVVLEMVNGRSMDLFMSQPATVVTTSERYDIILCVACGLEYLHTRTPAVVHGHVKSSNVLIERRSDRMHAKLSDFGLSQVFARQRRPSEGSVAWMAPDLYNKSSMPSLSSDVFSFGRLLYFIAVGIKPLQNLDRRSIKQILRTGVLPVLNWPGTSPLEEHCKPCVDDCSQVSPEMRPSMQQLHDRIEAWPIDSAVQRKEGATGWVQGIKDLDKAVFARNQRGTTASAQQNVSELASSGLPSIPENQSMTSRRQPLLPQFRPTPFETQMQLLALTIRRCNCEVSEVGCCPLHTSTRSLVKVCKELIKGNCDQTFFNDVEGQCMACGVLALDIDPDDLTCDICDGTIKILDSSEESLNSTAATGSATM